MSLQDIVALMRRHLAAVLVVVVCAAALAMVFKRTPIPYQESGTVVFSAPGSARYPNPYTSFNGSLVDAAGVIALAAMSPKDQGQVRAAGGTAAYDITLVNSYNLEYPDYSDPYDTVVATGADPAQVNRTFELVVAKMDSDLTAGQAQADVSAVNRITAHVLGDSGPLAQPGSSKRVYAALLALTIIAAFAIAIWLDRHPLWSRRLRALDPRRLRVGGRPSSPLREQPAP